MDDLTLLQLESIKYRLLVGSVLRDGCRIWTKSLTSKGYGQISITVNGKKRPEKAHRASWRVHHGPIPPGMLVCHKCDNTVCIHEDHLFLGTPADNSKDMALKGRSHGSYKLEDQGVSEILSLLNYGINQQEIADAYGISRSYVSAINTKVRQRLAQSSG